MGQWNNIDGFMEYSWASQALLVVCSWDNGNDGHSSNPGNPGVGSA
jgi:hypothetical protein